VRTNQTRSAHYLPWYKPKPPKLGAS